MSKLKQYWWFLLIIVAIPLIINYIVLTPALWSVAGNKHDWINFWGTYIGGIIGAVISFYILYKQLGQNQSENVKNRDLQTKVIEYQVSQAQLNQTKIHLADLMTYISREKFSIIISELNIPEKREFIFSELKDMRSNSNKKFLLSSFDLMSFKDEYASAFNKFLENYMNKYQALIDDLEWFLKHFKNSADYIFRDQFVFNILINQYKASLKPPIIDENNRIWNLCAAESLFTSDPIKDIIIKRINTFDFAKIGQEAKLFLDDEQQKLKNLISEPSSGL